MNLGDIILNRYAGDMNPNRKMIYLRSDRYYIYCLGVDGIEIKFDRSGNMRDKFLEVIGGLDLSKWIG